MTKENFQIPLRLLGVEKRSKYSDAKITFYETKYSSNKTKMSNMRIKKIKILWWPITFSFLLTFTPSIKTLESNMVSRSLGLNKILNKHMGNESKNMKKKKKKKRYKNTILKKKNMKNKSNYKEKFM